MNILDLHRETWTQLDARRARLPHALLFSGPKAIGKRALSLAFAESLLCEQPSPERTACGQCPACSWLAQGNHPDFRLLQPDALAEDDEKNDTEKSESKKKPSQQITIDQIRALDDFLHVGTHRHGARIILIHPAEAMNRATANALLKSLEEPSASTLFILVSNEPERLLPTIRSRCQTLSIPLPSASRATQWLQDHGVTEAGQWLALAGGAPLLALDLAQSDERFLLDALVAELSRAPRFDPLQAAAALDRTVKAEKRPAALKRVIEWGQKWLADLALVSHAQSPRYFLAQTEVLRRQAAASEPTRILAFGRKAIQYKAQCDQPLNSRLLLEDFFLGFAVLFRSDARRP